jgi:superfamily II DNA/RNA helicase
MSSIKRHKHRIHPCLTERKAELLKHLLTCNDTSSILVVTSQNLEDVQKIVNDKDIIVTDDANLADFPELSRDMLISYDLPQNAEDYLARISHATTHALILLDSTDQNSLYPIETLLGRTLMQEVIKGFEIEDIKPDRDDKRPAKKYNDFNSRNSRDNKPYRDKKPKYSTPKRTTKRVSIKSIKPKSEGE